MNCYLKIVLNTVSYECLHVLQQMVGPIMKKRSLRKKFFVMIAGCQRSANSFETFLSQQMTNIGFQDVGIESNHISVAQDVMNTKDVVCYQHCNNYFEVELQI